MTGRRTLGLPKGEGIGIGVFCAAVFLHKIGQAQRSGRLRCWGANCFYAVHLHADSTPNINETSNWNLNQSAERN